MALDLALVLDSSGSMADNDPQGLRRSESKKLVDTLLVSDRASVVDFDGSARLAQALTSDKAALKAAIDTIDDSGSTNIGAGVRTGIDSLGAQGDPARVMVLLTDGDGSYSADLTTEAKSKSITIYTIGLGSAVNETLLRDIAAGTGGQYFPVADASQLAAAFDEIHHNNVDDGTDTDGDGLTDCQERNGAISGPFYGKRYTSDPTLADTDGDGLSDSAEIGPKVLDFLGPDFTWNLVFSDPRLADTDGDGLSDSQEKTRGTKPFIADTDGDGKSDGDEVRDGTDPLVGAAFDKMLKSLRDFAADAKCTGDGAGCSNDDFVRKASEQLAGLDPGRHPFTLLARRAEPREIPRKRSSAPLTTERTSSTAMASLTTTPSAARPDTSSGSWRRGTFIHEWRTRHCPAMSRRATPGHPSRTFAVVASPSTSASSFAAET